MKNTMYVGLMVGMLTVLNSAQAEEGLHLEFGLGVDLALGSQTDEQYADQRRRTYKYWYEVGDPAERRNVVVGEVELYYEWSNGVAVYFRHTSDVQQSDMGTNIVGLKAKVF